MARTFLVGNPVAEHADLIAEQARLARSALEQARQQKRPVQASRPRAPRRLRATCSSPPAAIRPSGLRADPEQVDGFQFSLGHGVGCRGTRPRRSARPVTTHWSPATCWRTNWLWDRRGTAECSLRISVLGERRSAPSDAPGLRRGLTPRDDAVPPEQPPHLDAYEPQIMS
jgi:hypothetical protein